MCLCAYEGEKGERDAVQEEERGTECNIPEEGQCGKYIGVTLMVCFLIFGAAGLLFTSRSAAVLVVVE